MVGGGVFSTGLVGETKLLSKANIRPLLYCSLAVFGAVTYGYDGTVRILLVLPLMKAYQDC